MEVILVWIVASFLIASYGDKRKIGFFTALLICLLLSPLIGFLCVLLSDKKDPPKPPTTTGFDIERYRAN